MTKNLSEYSVIGDYPDLSVLYNSRIVSVDVETTGLEFMADIIGISIAWYGTHGKICSCYLHKNNFGQMSLEILNNEKVNAYELLNHISTKCISVFHNLPFDFRILWRELDIPIPGEVYDTMHLSRSVESQDSLSLIDLYRKIDKDPPVWYEDIKGSRGKLLSMPVSTRAEYARVDAEITLEIAWHFLLRMEKSENFSLMKEDMEFTKLVLRMIKRGVEVDYAWLHNKASEFTVRMLEIEGIFRKKGLRNLGSRESEAIYLFHVLKLNMDGVPLGKKKNTYFKSGIPSVAKGVLDKWRGKVGEVDLIIEYRELQKALGSWINPAINEARWDGKIHSILNPFGANTTRMKSSEFNMQAIPLEDRGYAYGSMKGIFKASQEGMNYYKADIKQAEIRLVAITTRDINLLETISSGEDPYISMSERLWGTPDRRQDAKHATLAAIYEIGPKRFYKEYGGRSIKEAADIINQFRRIYKRTSSIAKTVNSVASVHRTIRLWDGRIIFLSPWDQSYKAFNWTIQGGVATLLRKSMLSTEKLLPESLVLQTHDDMTLKLEDKYARDQLDEVEGLVQDSFVDLDLPIKIEFKLDKEKW